MDCQTDFIAQETDKSGWYLKGWWFHAQQSLLYWDSQQTAFIHLIVFSVILEEIQRTSCQPREVCVEVAKEYPESTSQFYLPRCVALHRCGGCCANEAFYCTNTSYTLVNKTVSNAVRFSSPSRLSATRLCWHFSAHTPQTASESRTETNLPSYVTS